MVSAQSLPFSGWQGTPDLLQRTMDKRASVTVAVCKDYLRGRCSRTESECRYAHPPSGMSKEATSNGDIVTVCFDFLRERCSRGAACRYFHPPPQMRMILEAQAGISPLSGLVLHRPQRILNTLLMQPPSPTIPPLAVKPLTRPALEVCRDFVRGRCSRDDQECRYAHILPTNSDTDLVTVCQDYLKGRCERETCRYFHPPENLKARIKDIPTGSGVVTGRDSAVYEATYKAYSETLLTLQQQAKRLPYDPQEDDLSEVFRNLPIEPGSFQKAFLETINPSFSQRQKQILRGIKFNPANLPKLQAYGGSYPPCNSGYGYLSSLAALEEKVYGVGIGNEDLRSPLRHLPSGDKADTDKLPVCRDFLRDKCIRGSSCRFVHPEPHVPVNDNMVTVCRDALRGKCIRDACRFYHPLRNQTKQPFNRLNNVHLHAQLYDD